MADDCLPEDLVDLDGELEGEPPPGFLEELEGNPEELTGIDDDPGALELPPEPSAPELPPEPEKPKPKPARKVKPAKTKDKIQSAPQEETPPPVEETNEEPPPEASPEVIGKKEPKRAKKPKPKPAPPPEPQVVTEIEPAPDPLPPEPSPPAPEPTPAPAPAPTSKVPSNNSPVAPPEPKAPPIAPPVAVAGPSAPGYSEIVFDDEKPPASSPQRYEVRHHSNRAGVVLNSMYLCYASPFFITLFLILLGWNEKRAVCDERMISKAREVVIEVGCSTAAANHGELIMLSCEVSQQGLSKIIGGGSAFADEYYTGTCLNTQSQMYQCVEHQRETDVKVGNRTGKKTTYTYTKEWKQSRVDSSRFNSNARNSTAFSGCSNDTSFQNPHWPNDVPSTSVIHADPLFLGAFRATGVFLPHLECSTPVTNITNVSADNWTLATDKWYYRGAGGNEITQLVHIGDTRLRFSTNAWTSDQTLYTGVGKNNGGTLEKWTAPSSWLCSGSTLGTFTRKGTVSKDQWFDELKTHNQGLTWTNRIVFFLFLWASLCCLFGPLEIVVDMVPFIGRYLGNVVEKLICIVTCPPASCLCIGVCSIVWIAMRPGVMVPLFLLFICSVGGFLVFLKMARDTRKKNCPESMKQRLNP